MRDVPLSKSVGDSWDYIKCRGKAHLNCVWDPCPGDVSQCKREKEASSSGHSLFAL